MTNFNLRRIYEEEIEYSKELMETSSLERPEEQF